MWDVDATTRLLKEMSRSVDPERLVRLFFEHVRRNIDVERALVLIKVGSSSAQYRLVHDAHGTDDVSDAVVTSGELRQGGLLAKLLDLGGFQSISDLTPDPSDPAFDLLRGSRSLTAFPLFENGATSGMVVMLSPTPRAYGIGDQCALALICSLLGRAIETQRLVTRFDSELQDAADVQRWLLPPSIPVLAHAEIAVSYRPAHRSGGDYYDVAELPDGRVGMLIADVSGKGAAAAMIMAVLRTILHELELSRMTGPAALLDHADARLRTLGLSQRRMFVTAFSCVLDPSTGTLVYSSAGHSPPRVLRARHRTVMALDGANATPLGMLDEPWTHTEEAVVLMPGDLVVAYTDGITEARSPAGGFFGEDRLDEILRTLPGPVTPAAAVEAVVRAVGEFGGTGPPSDDQTLLALSPS